MKPGIKDNKNASTRNKKENGRADDLILSLRWEGWIGANHIRKR